MANILPGLSSLFISLWVSERILALQRTTTRDLGYHSRKFDCPVEVITSIGAWINNNDILRKCMLPDLATFRGQHDITPAEILEAIIENCEMEGCDER